MRFGKQYKYGVVVKKRKFAILPMKKMGQWRWLEWVEYSGVYWRGQSGTLYWEDNGWSN